VKEADEDQGQSKDRQDAAQKEGGQSKKEHL